MGTLVPAGRDAPLKLAEALQNGQHVAMLVDQYLTNGVDVTFFGRKTKANPTLARLLRQVECPIHGVRIIRLPNHRFRAELSEEVKPVRDADGQIDIAGHDAGGHVESSKAGSANIRTSGCGCTDGGGSPRSGSWPTDIATGAKHPGYGSHFPVFTLVQSRLMMRCVAGSRALITNSFFCVASSG